MIWAHVACVRLCVCVWARAFCIRIVVSLIVLRFLYCLFDFTFCYCWRVQCGTGLTLDLFIAKNAHNKSPTMPAKGSELCMCACVWCEGVKCVTPARMQNAKRQMMQRSLQLAVGCTTNSPLLSERRRFHEWKEANFMCRRKAEE